MSVTLRKRKNSDGTTSLLLDVYNNGKRSYEFLKHLKLSQGSNPADKQKNKENLQIAEKIALKRAQELSAKDYNMTTDIGKRTDVVEWMQDYIDKYQKKDKRNMQGALNRFKAFLVEDKKTGLTFGQIDEVIISDYQDSLIHSCTYTGASSYFTRFKKMMKRAHAEKLIQHNPAAFVRTKNIKAKTKEILTMDEIKILSKTPTESEEVKRAAIFSCVTGLAWIDIKMLTWEDVNIKERVLNKPRQKTGEEVYINLNDVAVRQLGKPGNKNEFIFNLPTANGANKTLKAWIKRAGITKTKITWHNLRHSFGTNLYSNSIPLHTIAKLMGHSTTKHTQIYAKISDDLKQRATDTLNF